MLVGGEFNKYYEGERKSFKYYIEWIYKTATNI